MKLFFRFFFMTTLWLVIYIPFFHCAKIFSSLPKAIYDQSTLPMLLLVECSHNVHCILAKKNYS